MAEYDYDMLVVGSGPAGQRAAIQAAKLDKRVAIVERKEAVGGVAVNVGTIPSKTIREAVLYLSGHRERGAVRRRLRGEKGCPAPGSACADRLRHPSRG